MAIRTEASILLESGDRMTRDEFHRWYLANPRIKKAELIDGVVYVPSPVRLAQHGRPHGLMVTWLGFYASQAPDVILGDNATIFLDDGVEAQPDALLWRPVPGGAELTPDGYLTGAPQLVVEVAASSVSYDLHEKLEAYRRNRVGEYIVWRIFDNTIDWLRLQGDAYVRVEPDGEGIIESDRFPGLRLHVPSMLAGDLAAVFARVRRPTGP